MFDFEQSDEPMIRAMGREAGYAEARRRAGALAALAQDYGTTLTGLALRYTLELCSVGVPIVGSRDAGHIREMASSLSAPLPPIHEIQAALTSNRSNSQE